MSRSPKKKPRTNPLQELMEETPNIELTPEQLDQFQVYLPTRNHTPDEFEAIVARCIRKVRNQEETK